MLEEHVDVHPDSTTWGGWLGACIVEVLAAQGDTARARRVLEELRAADPESLVLAWARTRLGETDRAWGLSADGRFPSEIDG